MTLPDFLFQSVDSLRAGDYLLPEEVLPLLESARDQLEEWAVRVEDDPLPEGLEALSEATVEALECFAEALDYLELAAREDIPELADSISEKTQDALDILRDVRQRSQTQHTILSEEMATRG